FAYMVDYIDRISYVELSLHFWDKTYLIMVDDFLILLICICCQLQEYEVGVQLILTKLLPRKN
ncbi:hypothetical protein STEG23_019016, partial [Scotinomys teguina]